MLCQASIIAHRGFYENIGLIMPRKLPPNSVLQFTLIPNVADILIYIH